MRVDHWLRSEAMLDAFGVTEQNWQDACARVPGFALFESPTYVARGVAALAADPQLSGLAGQTPGATTNDTAWATTPRQIGQYVLVVFGAHLVLYSQDAEADRQFLAETLGMGSVDAGHGWLIFAMPPTEAAVHPADVAGAELYLMCEDLTAEIEALAARGVSCSPVEEARWGSITKIALPGGGEIGLYQPRHPLAIDRDE